LLQQQLPRHTIRHRADVAAEDTVVVPVHRRAKRGRKPHDAALPREVIRHELSEFERICPNDGARLEEIGAEASEQLDIVPAQVRIIRYEQVKYPCPCWDQALRIAPAPLRLTPRVCSPSQRLPG
jgi:transposase